MEWSSCAVKGQFRIVIVLTVNRKTVEQHEAMTPISGSTSPPKFNAQTQAGPFSTLYCLLALFTFCVHVRSKQNSSMVYTGNHTHLPSQSNFIFPLLLCNIIMNATYYLSSRNMVHRPSRSDAAIIFPIEWLVGSKCAQFLAWLNQPERATCQPRE